MSRRTFPEPQEYKSGGKVIGYIARWRTPDGKRPYKLFPFVAFEDDDLTSDDTTKKKTDTRLKAYNAAKAELRRQIGESQAYADGTKTFIASDKTLGQFYEEHWLPERNAIKRQPKNDQSTWNKHLKDVFADTPLKAFIDPKVAANFQGKLTATAKRPATARNVMALLKAMLNYAVELGELPNNLPKIRRVTVTREGFNVLKSDAEIGAFLDAALKQDFEHRAVYAVACCTGMRIGEIVSLHWRDVNFDAGRIMVRFSHSKATKSGKPRSVPILVRLEPILKEWQELSKDKPNELGLVFPPTKKGKMYRPDTELFTDHYRAALIAAGIETEETPKADRIRFHDLRHTFASLFLANGGSLLELKEILGHASLATTNVYSHFLPNTFRGASGSFALAKPPQPAEPPPEPKPKPEAPPKKKRTPKPKVPRLRLVKQTW